MTPEEKLMRAIFGEKGKFLKHKVGGIGLRTSTEAILATVLPSHRSKDPEKMIRVIRLRFGFDDPQGKGQTLAAIGKEFHVTPERIRQIEAKALRGLRHHTRASVLSVYLREVTK